jgi:actinin alpha
VAYNHFILQSFSAWANFYLQRRGLKCENLTVDFCDGTLLIALVEELSGKPVPFKYLKKPKLKIQKLENASLILTYMKNVLKIRLTGIGAEGSLGSTLPPTF